MLFRCFYLLTSGAFLVCSAITATACSQPGTITASYAWAPNVTVAVGIFGFPKPQDVQNSLDNWNWALTNQGYTCAAATFDSTISSSGYSLSITYGHINTGTSGSVIRGLTDRDSFDVNNRLQTADTTINNNVTDDTTITQVVTHEIGHTFALTDCPLCGVNSTVMETGDTMPSINGQISPVAPTNCDLAAISVAGFYPCGGGGIASGGGGAPSDCTYGYDPTTFDCYYTPIIISLDGKHPELTNAQNGVMMSTFLGSTKLQMAWTPPNVTSEGWLALDRDGNGLIGSLSELFGNFTPQPKGDPQTYNGFRALAVFDRRDAGGNEDGRISEQDAIFSRLRIWIDRNHDGVSQPDELLTLKEAGVVSISLDYHESRHSDQYGNRYRYRSAIEGDRDLFPWTYDVILTSIQNGKAH